MKNSQDWKPSKFEVYRGHLRASRNPAEIRVGSRLMGDRVAEFYDRFLKLHAHGDLIDLGCGKVPLYQSYRPYVQSITCVDWENTPHPSSHLDRAVDLSQPLPFPDRSFDTVILSDVLEHLPDPDLAWREISRLLRPEGVAFINVPFLYCLHEVPHDFYRYTEFALRRFAGRHDFETVILEPLGGSIDVFGDLFAKHLQFVPVIGKPVAAMMQSALSIVGRTAWGRRLRLRSGAHFPLGYLMVVRRRT